MGDMNKWSGPRAFLRALHERRVWALSAAYLVVGFGLVEASELVFPRLQLPSNAVDVLLAVLFFAFPVALLITWLRRADEESTRVPAVLPLLAVLVVGTGSAWLGVRALQTGPTETPAPPAAEPLVLMMDSHHPRRVYDEETVAGGGTNADVVSDILLDLPIRRQKEAVGSEWHRDEEMLNFRPSLIIIHYSAFRQLDSEGPRLRLRLLLEFFADSDTRFLIYSRRAGDVLQNGVDELLLDLDQQHPGFLDRVHTFSLRDSGELTFRGPATAAALKLRVKAILGLD